ncbi:MAG: hypothetical protein JWP45_360 [Mucilaginibacter sp.]|nr:hypothetical protein [Mucilaginibacter sp.]
MDNSISPQKITGLNHKYRFTIATLVTEMSEYQEMVHSFLTAGFTKDICEYIYIDNSNGNSFDAYQGINLFLQTAKAEYIIITHQDVLINFDTIDILNRRIDEIAKKDENWAILSNAGGIENNLYHRVAIHLVYGDGHLQKEGKFPQKVCSIDEHFILVKRAANLSLSHNLKGFHLYGTDICLIAELLGYSAYVIDFKITHKSYGNPDVSYHNILKQLIAKYVQFMRSRTIITTITDFRLSPSLINTRFFNAKFVKKAYRSIKKINTKSEDRKPHKIN